MFLDIFVAQELCTTESGNTNHRRSCFLPCNIIRTMPPLECANFLECENKTVCVAPFDLPHGSSTICFSSHTRKLSHSPCWAAGLLIFFGQNGLERDSMWNYRRLRWELHLPHIPEYVIPDHFSQKNEKKKLKTFHSPSTKILWNAQILPSAMIWQYEYLPSCGVRCPRWSAKKLWNAKNSKYAWLV